MASQQTAVASTDDAFEEFYRTHSEELRRALCLAVGEVDLGTEAADEAMARAYEHWANIDQRANPVGWAYRVGLNWARSRQRRYRWRDRRRPPDQPVLSAANDPEMVDALARLSSDHRAVVVCRYYLDWSVTQIADALDIPPGTVKSRLSRALGSLQNLLEE